MQVGLDGKVALVTGASRGIGAAIARGFVDAGAKVMLMARNRDDLETLATSLPDGSVEIYPGDVGSPEHAFDCVAAAVKAFGRLDILVNNAAASLAFGPAMEADPAHFDTTVDINVRAPLIWTQEAWRQSFAAGDGGAAVLNIASIGALRTVRGGAVYGLSKAALMHMTAQLAYELAPKVRVVGIAPGLVDTSMAGSIGDLTDRIAQIPMGRIGATQDIADAAVFLVSDAASWITGQTITIDGGQFLRPLSG